jgi:hypothetical protein
VPGGGAAICACGLAVPPSPLPAAAHDAVASPVWPARLCYCSSGSACKACARDKDSGKDRQHRQRDPGGCGRGRSAGSTVSGCVVRSPSPGALTFPAPLVRLPSCLHGNRSVLSSLTTRIVPSSETSRAPCVRCVPRDAVGLGRNPMPATCSRHSLAACVRSSSWVSPHSALFLSVLVLFVPAGWMLQGDVLTLLEWEREARRLR